MTNVTFGAGYGKTVRLSKLEHRILMYLDKNEWKTEKEIRSVINRDGVNRKTIHGTLSKINFSRLGLITSAKCPNKNILCYHISWDGRRVLFAIKCVKELEKYCKYYSLVRSYSAHRGEISQARVEIEKYILGENSDKEDFKVFEHKFPSDGETITIWFVYRIELKNAKFKPTYTVMKNIGERCARKDFPLEMERDKTEYMIRYNWKSGKSIGNYWFSGSIIYKEIGFEKLPVLYISLTMKPFHTKFSVAQSRINKKIAEGYLNKFKGKINNIKVTSSEHDLKFSGYYPAKSAKLKARELDIINDFIHGTYSEILKPSKKYGLY